MEIDVNFEGVQFRRNVFLIVEIEKYFSNRLIKSDGPARMTRLDIINMSEICLEVEFRPSVGWRLSFARAIPVRASALLENVAIRASALFKISPSERMRFLKKVPSERDLKK